MSQGEMTIGVGIRTELSTDARVRYESPPPFSGVTQTARCAVGCFPLRSDQNMWNLTCLVDNEGGNNHDGRDNSLYIRPGGQQRFRISRTQGYRIRGCEHQQLNPGNRSALPPAFGCWGCAQSPGKRTGPKFDIARSLGAIRSDIPIVLLCRGQIDCPPSWVDACINAGQSLEKVAAAVRRLLVAKRFQLLIAQI